MKDTANGGTPQEKPSKGCLPSTHLLGLHLAPGVDDAGLPAAGPQQVLPQVATRLFKALPKGREHHYNHRKQQILRERGKASCQGPLLRPLVSLWEQEPGREMGASVIQKSRCHSAPGKYNHQRITGLSGIRLSLHPLHPLFQIWHMGIF